MEGSIPLLVMRASDNYGSFINASRCYLFKVFAGLAPDVVRKRNFDSAGVTNRLYLNDLSLEDLEFASCFLSVPV